MAEVVARDGPESGAAHARQERLREGITMALYISLSLLAVMVAIPNQHPRPSSATQALTVFLAGVGLLLAHWVATRLSSRLVHGRSPGTTAGVLGAQLAGGLAVTLAAAIPILLISGDAGRIVGELLLLGLIVLAGYRAAGNVGLSRPRTLVYLVVVVLVAVGVIAFKAAFAH